MADGPPGIRRVFTRHGDNLDNLFRRKSGGGTRTWVIGQALHKHGGEHFITTLVGFYLSQFGGEGAPPSAPHLDRLAIEMHLAHDMALSDPRLQGQQNRGPPRQTLGASLTAGNLLQAGSLSCSQLYPGRDRGKWRNSGNHTSILSEELGHFWPL